MNLDISRLKQIFDLFPEPVLYMQGSQTVYANPPGEALFSSDSPAPLSALCSLLPQAGGETQWATAQGVFHVTASPFDEGSLFVLRPVAEERPVTYSNVPVRLREHLSGLSAASERLVHRLTKDHDLASYQELLSMQSQVIHRMLRLAQQIELSGHPLELDYSMEAVDLVALCREVFFELSSRLEGEGPKLSFQTELRTLVLSGNQDLLQQLLLSLLSNAIQSATLDGAVTISLDQKQNRALLSVWDNGPGIPEDRLMGLFTQTPPQSLPRPGEGAGLDLFLAHRIVSFHEGVIMAANHPNGGAELTVSLPVKPPEALRLRSQDLLESGRDFSPVMIGLSDVLPLRVYRPPEEL